VGREWGSANGRNRDKPRAELDVDLDVEVDANVNANVDANVEMMAPVKEQPRDEKEISREREEKRAHELLDGESPLPFKDDSETSIEVGIEQCLTVY
jgi:hypothetical protein